MTGQDILNKLIDIYRADFDVIRPYHINEDYFDAYAVLHVSNAKYVLVKKAELWRADCNEHVFFVQKPDIELDDLEHFKQTIISHIEPLLVRGGESCTKKDHMYTYITKIFIIDNGITEEVKRAVKKFRFFKNYRWGLRGYCEARILVIDTKNQIITSNRAAEDLTKGYRKLLGI